MHTSTLKTIIAAAFFIIVASSTCFGQIPVFSYTTPNAYIAGTQIQSLKPTVSVGPVTAYTISPSLPDSLKFDTKTGTISGKPLKSSIGTYCITASNDKGPGKCFQLDLVVLDKKDCPKTPHLLSEKEWLLVFLPPVAFLTGLILLLIYTWVIGRISNTQDSLFNLRQALSESSYPQIIKENTEYSPENIKRLLDIQEINTGTAALPVITLFPTTITITDNKYRPSISRLIAFMTSMVSLLIGICLSSFFIYSFLKDGTPPDLTKLSGVLISMGIGVVPYAFNKISTMAGGGSGNAGAVK